MSGQLFGGARERPSLHRVASAGLAALLAVPIALVGLVVASAPAGAATAPDPPTAVTVTLGNTAALVAFTPGNNNGDPVTQFDTVCTGASNPDGRRERHGEPDPGRPGWSTATRTRAR